MLLEQTPVVGAIVGSNKLSVGEHQLAAFVYEMVLGMEGNSQITIKLYLVFLFKF